MERLGIGLTMGCSNCDNFSTGATNSIVVKEEGVSLGSFTALNFVGDGATATNAGGGVAQITVPGGFLVWKAGVPWATVYAALSAMTGPKILLVEWDEATSGVRTLSADPGGGVGTPQDLNQVWFLGVGGNENTPTITVEDGAKLASSVQGTLNIARLSSKSINWDFSALTSAMFDATAAGDFSIFAFEQGDIAGATGGVAVVQGAMHLALWNANVSDILCNVIDLRSDAQLTARCALSTGFANAGPPGTTLSVISDATCYIDPQLLIDFPGSARTVATYAKNAGGALFAITVDGGGNVIATPVI